MNMLITDAGKGAFLLRGQDSPIPIPCGAECACMPAACLGKLILLSEKNRTCYLIDRKTLLKELEFSAPPGVSALCPSPCGRWLYILSSEADMVHGVHLGTGELCFAAPAGVFPRCMRLSPDGNHLLVAGGAENTACILTVPQFFSETLIQTRHPCFSADFWQEGLVLVCAAGGEDIQTAVYTLAHGKRRPRELLRLHGMPGALRVCPDGVTALLSTPDGLMRICLRSGKLLWNFPEGALAMELSLSPKHVLVSDLPGGEVILLPLHLPWPRRTLWKGENAQACFL